MQGGPGRQEDGAGNKAAEVAMIEARILLRGAAGALLLATTACVQHRLPPAGAGPDAGAVAAEGNGAAAGPAAVARVKESIPAHPADAFTNGSVATQLRQRALGARGLRILVSTEDRALWLMRNDEIVFSAPVAVGMHERFEWDGRVYDFTTPIGQRRVLAKAPNPFWTPPDWHYFEKAAERNLQVVHLRNGMRVPLEDGTVIEVRGSDVGRVNSYGNFWPFTPGTEIIFDSKIFIPPFGTRQRRIDAVLGTHKLELGDGYLIHGTDDDSSIGGAVSHGCVRMYNDDVEALYRLVPVGTPVYLF
jgi:hypothetical protein